MSVQVVILIVATFASAFIQGATGFGYAVVMMPILLWLDFPVVDAIVISAVTSIVQVCLTSFQLRQHLLWGLALYALVIRSLGLPIGLWLLARLELLSSSQIRQVIGLILLTVVLLQLALKIKARDNLHPLWGIFAFISSGILQGVASIGGPATVLWVMAQTWTNQTSRAFTVQLLMLTLPIQLALLYFSYGQAIIPPTMQSLWLLPVVALGTYVGVVFGNQISKVQLRKMVYALIILLALSSMLSPYLT